MQSDDCLMPPHAASSTGSPAFYQDSDIGDPIVECEKSEQESNIRLLKQENQSLQDRYRSMREQNKGLKRKLEKALKHDEDKGASFRQLLLLYTEAPRVIHVLQTALTQATAISPATLKYIQELGAIVNSSP